MICDFLSLDEVKELSGASYSDALIMKLYDNAVDFITQNLNHSFGQALRIWHDGTGAVAATFTYTIQVTSTGIVLTTTNPASSTTLLFTAYPTLMEMALGIEGLSGGSGGVLGGWEAVVSFPEMSDQPSSLLRAVTVTQGALAAGNTGYAYRKVICSGSFYEILSGNGESRLFLSMPIASLTSVCEDGVVLTEGTDFWAKRPLGVLIRMGCAGSQYARYGVDCWSVAEPNNVPVVYTPTWFAARPAALTGAINGLMALALSTSGYQSEKIGDYSYVKDGASALMWMQTLESYIAPLSIF